MAKKQILYRVYLTMSWQTAVKNILCQQIYDRNRAEFATSAWFLPSIYWQALLTDFEFNANTECYRSAVEIWSPIWFANLSTNC